MKDLSPVKGRSPVLILISLILALFSVYAYYMQPKWLTMAVGLGLIALVAFSHVQRLKRIPVLLILGFLTFNGLTAFWALSGKFFLREFSTLFIAVALFLLVVLWDHFGKAAMQKIMGVLAGVGAVFGLLSVESAATGLFGKVVTGVTGIILPSVGFEAGTRLTGIFGNANIMSTILAISIFCSVALLQGAQEKKERILYALLLSLNAYAMLLSFSMGGIACFALAIVVYLVFAGEDRGSVLIRMLEGAVPAMAWGFAAFPFFNKAGFVSVLPLVFMAANAVTVILLEEQVAARLSRALKQRQKLVLIILAAIVAVGAVYVVAGYHMSGPHTFDGESLRRSAYPEAGGHVLNVEADGEVSVTITSQNMSQVMMHTDRVIYKGSADHAEFTVPEGSEVCYFTFSAGEGVTISEASIDGAETIRLNYTLLPGFIANRLQGLWANQNAIQRTVFFEDGMKLFKQSPLLGNGMGSFETGITSVQEFYYETRYVHNHYIQILVEAGIIGLVLYVGSLLSLAGLLWKHRKEEDELNWSRPALWAVLAMVAAHGMVEVSMSVIMVQCFAFTAFGLIVAANPGKAAVEEAVEEQSVSGKKKKKQKKAEVPRKSASEYALKGVCIALPAVFVITLGMNMVAKKMMSSPAVDADAFLDKLENAAELDPYEYNDAKLSYLYITLDYPSDAHIQTANRFASELELVQSNTLPQGLTHYYGSTGQYEKAIQAANLAAVYSATNADSWNAVISTLWGDFLGGAAEPLTEENGKELLQGLVDYYETLKEHNRTSMETIELTVLNKQFFTEVLNLQQELQNHDTIAGKLLYRSWLSCDADEDGISDQLTRMVGAEQKAGGEIVLQENGSVDIEVETGSVPAVRIVVECEDPEVVELVDVEFEEVKNPYKIEGGTATYLLINTGAGVGNKGFRIQSAQAQTLAKVEISTHIE